MCGYTVCLCCIFRCGKALFVWARSMGGNQDFDASNETAVLPVIATSGVRIIRTHTNTYTDVSGGPDIDSLHTLQKHTHTDTQDCHNLLHL